jgi:hypothetical protein
MATELVHIAEQNLTPKERALLTEITKSDSTVEVVIPPEIDPADWMFTASVVCKGLVRAQIQEQSLLVVLGRLLIIARDNPSIYKDNGYEGFEDFLAGEIRTKWGVSRSTCYESMGAAEFAARAGLTGGDVKEIGRVKMREIVKVIQEGEEGKAATRKLIAKAKESTVEDFRQHLDNQYHVSRGDTIGARISFGSSKTVEKMWRDWIENPDVQEYAQSGKPDRILKKMIEYCSEWLAAAHDADRAEGE